MSMSTQVTSLSRSITYHLRNISRIRHYLDFETCNHVVRSLVLSRLDYGNILLLGSNVTEIARLQRLQNWAAKIIFLAAKKDHASHCSTNCTGYLWGRESTTKPCCMFTNALLVWGQIIWHPPWHYISLEDKDFDLLLMLLACMCPKSITGHSNQPLTRHLFSQLLSCGTSYLFQSAPPTLCLCSKKSWKPFCFLKFNAFCLYTCIFLVLLYILSCFERCDHLKWRYLKAYCMYVCISIWPLWRECANYMNGLQFIEC